MTNGYFIALLIIRMLNLGIALGRHGEEKHDEYNFFLSLFGSMVSLFIIYMAIKKGF